MPREYATAQAFRKALEDRFQKTAETEQIQVNRLRRQVAFDRLLARLFRVDPVPWVLKGGYALELRFRTARATIDIPLVPTISREQQFAEKLHAYTLPRNTTNSRVKDLVDLVLLIEAGGLVPERVGEALRLTFERRTHILPSELLHPPPDWQRRFQALAEECQLGADMGAVLGEIQAFLNRVTGRESRI